MRATEAHQGEPALETSVRIDPGTTLVTARGELDLATSGAFRGLLLGLIRPDSPRVVIDVSALKFCDSQGLSAFVAAENRAEAYGGGVSLIRVRPQLAKILRLTGLDHRLLSRPR